MFSNHRYILSLCFEHMIVGEGEQQGGGGPREQGVPRQPRPNPKELSELTIDKNGINKIFLYFLTKRRFKCLLNV